MKTFLTLFLVATVYCHTLHAQFNDDFTDNNFTTNPAWTGDESKFTVVANQLKLQAVATTSTAFLSTPSTAINNASWEFFIQLDFTPSSTNLANVYLVSDQSVLSGSLRGYFVKIGNTADEISLYRQDGLSEVKIIDGLDGRLNLAVVKAKIKITRDGIGNWQLSSDVGVAGTYALEGIANDNTYNASTFFGVNCKYTDTRSDKFRLDDFAVTGDPFVDLDPPTLQQLKPVSDHELELVFSEPLQPLATESTVNYVVDHEVGNPSTVRLLEDGTTVYLSFTKKFPNGVSCMLSVSGVEDIFHNLIAPAQKMFLFFQPRPTVWKDVVVNEIMVDPTPQVGLPNAEFIELLNRSAHPVDLANWYFAKGNSTAKFSSTILLPGDYLIFTSAANALLFSEYRVMPLSNFPTQTNAGDVVILKNADGLTIDSVQYNDSWYNDDDKKMGGWSLELIDPMNTCAERTNWTATEDDLGGTPGKKNSVYANKPDVTGPTLISGIPVAPTTITLTFNEKLERSLPSLSSFSIEPSLPLKEISFIDKSLTAINITTREAISTQATYTITTTKIYDCAGNAIQPEFNTTNFGMPAEADSLDVVINEILFNPKPGGVDFVELYNRSLKHINLKNWSVANFENGIAVNSKPIVSYDLLLKPGTYVVLTSDIDIIKSGYRVTHDENFLETLLPSLNDDEGSVAILDENKNIIDVFLYTDDMHSIFINDPEGVSLERITFDQPTGSPQNWRSANASAGFATPGYLNSNVREFSTAPAEETVTVDPEIFIPSYGNPNYTMIKYNFAQGGNLANVKIYDTDGREIKLLANNEVLGTEGFFRWDGDQNNGIKARIGYYVVNFEIVNTNGSVKTFRKRVVVATEF